MPDPTRPNVILINCDDLGYGDLGCYGSRRNDTPNADRLAAEGTRFTHFCMASCVCSPSRAAMLTGCHPARIGFDRFGEHPVLFPGDALGLDPAEETLATLLRRRGYATQMVGKWHCGDQPAFLPTAHGFDHYLGIPYSNDMGRQVGRDRMLPPLPMLRDQEVVDQQFDMAAVTQRYTEESVRFVRENRERPFFLYLAHMYVHLPLIVPERLLARSRNGPYGAAVAAIDWSTGRLLRELDELGLAEGTLVLFTSDNGSRVRGEGGSNGPLRGLKGESWEGGYRVPLIARMPGRVPAGETREQLVASMDLLPTVAALTGADAPERPIDGRDRSALLLGGEDDGGDSEGDFGGNSGGGADRFVYTMGETPVAIRDARHKLFVARETVPGGVGPVDPVLELYDLREDPGESENLAGRRPGVVQRLRAELDAWAARLGPGGPERRGCGRVEDPRPLTAYDASYPYFAAEYDLPDTG